MLIKDYSGIELEADVVYAIPTPHGNDYVKLDFDELKVYAMVNRMNYATSVASATMINVSE